jgi:hypothetical protein
MFEDWKRAWREAVANFHHELSGGEGPEHAAHRRALRREIATARGVLAQLDREIRSTRQQLDSERGLEADCRRREALARAVGDAETVRIAIEFAGRHGERAHVLERKAAVLQEERALLARDVESMERLAPGDVAADDAGIAGSSGENSTHTDDAAFRRMREQERERAAAERLEELKRRMR